MVWSVSPRLPAGASAYDDKLDVDEHAQSHPVIARTGKLFPECLGCHDLVQFRLYQPEEYIGDNGYLRV
jgi:hypothetical protein